MFPLEHPQICYDFDSLANLLENLKTSLCTIVLYHAQHEDVIPFQFFLTKFQLPEYLSNQKVRI